jgi:hypothetical protein
MLYAKDPPKLSPAEQEVVDVSKARIDAASRRDTVAVARYFADDCLLSTDDGTLITKTQLMEHYRKTPAALPRARMVKKRLNDLDQCLQPLCETPPSAGYVGCETLYPDLLF